MGNVIASSILGLLVVGCTGVVSGDLDSRDEPEGGESFDSAEAQERSEPTDIEDVDPRSCEAAPVRPSMRLLTRGEYERVVSLLAGEPLRVAGALIADGLLASQSQFPTNMGLALDDQRFAAFSIVAEQAADPIASRLEDTHRCLATNSDAACLHSALAPLLRLAYRRETEPDELEAVVELVHSMSQKLSVPRALRMGVAAILQSPDVLYHIERGIEVSGTDGRLRLSDSSLAARLSFFITGGPPTAELLDAAAAGELMGAEGIAIWTSRLMISDEGVAHLTRQVRRWMHSEHVSSLSKSSARFDAFSSDIASEMETETNTFIQQNMISLLRPAREWLTLAGAPSEALMGFYGDQSDVPQIGERRGLLMHGSWLATHSGAEANVPTARGKFIAEELLCFKVPPPPPGLVIPEIIPPNADQTTRERFEQHNSMPCAVGCHSIMDPPGFAFEHFDAVGRMQLEDNGKPVDASGQLNIGSLQDTFFNANELVEIVAASDRYARCLPTKWFEVALARPLSGRDDCTAAKVAERFAQSDGSFESLLIAITTDPFFYTTGVAHE